MFCLPSQARAVFLNRRVVEDFQRVDVLLEHFRTFFYCKEEDKTGLKGYRMWLLIGRGKKTDRTVTWVEKRWSRAYFSGNFTEGLFIR